MLQSPGSGNKVGKESLMSGSYVTKFVKWKLGRERVGNPFGS